MVGGLFPNFTCAAPDVWSEITPPNPGAALAGFPISPLNHYFVQGEHTWKAPCVQYSTGVNVHGAWGDNLGGDAALKTGSPIRVEIVLWDTGLAAGQQGYFVEKLEPAELDRYSAYGHLASGTAGGWFPNAYTVGDALPDGKTFGAVVYDANAGLVIQQVATGQNVVEGAAGAEINATGKIIYGYNLRVVEAGKYLISYTMPNVTFDDCDIGSCEASVATLEIEVVAGGGGGGGGQGNQGGRKAKKPHPIHPVK